MPPSKPVEMGINVAAAAELRHFRQFLGAKEPLRTLLGGVGRAVGQTDPVQACRPTEGMMAHSFGRTTPNSVSGLCRLLRQHGRHTRHHRIHRAHTARRGLRASVLCETKDDPGSIPAIEYVPPLLVSHPVIKIAPPVGIQSP